jgi:hypothetical protein
VTHLGGYLRIMFHYPFSCLALIAAYEDLSVSKCMDAKKRLEGRMVWGIKSCKNRDMI